MNQIERDIWVAKLLAFHLPRSGREVLAEWQDLFDRAADGSLADKFPGCDFALICLDDAEVVEFFLYIAFDRDTLWSHVQINAALLPNLQARQQVARQMVKAVAGRIWERL